MAMPNTTAQNPSVGDAAELWFASQLPTGWIWQPPRRDVGKDALIVINDGSDLQNLEFSVQVKATAQPRIGPQSISYSGLPTSAVLYWFASPQPTLVVLVDISQKRAWYSWHLDLFESAMDISNKATCSIKVPLSNVLDSSGWSSIRDRLRSHYSALHEALGTARLASRIVPSIRKLADAARDLVWLDHEPDRPCREDFTPEDHNAVFLLIHDQCCYRDILDAVRATMSLFQRDSYTLKQMSLWLPAFEAYVLVAYPAFADLPRADNYAGVKIVFNAPALRSTRAVLISATLDMIAMLSA